MRVLRVVTLGSHSGRYGGPWVTAGRQAEALRLQGHDARMMYIYSEGDKPSGTPGTPDFNIRSRHTRIPVGALLPAQSLLTAWRAVRWSEVVHVSLAREALPLLACLLALALGRRLVVQPHGMLLNNRGWIKTVLDYLLVSRIFHRADLGIFLTATEERASHPKFVPRRRMILGNPVSDSLLEHENSLRTNTVAFIARLHPRKRVDTFLAAAASNSTCTNQQTKWIVAGPDGGTQEIVEAAAQRVNGLHFLGALTEEEVRRTLLASDIFVLTARDEPWGNVLVTALAAGLICIVTRSSHLAPALEEAQAALIIDDGDADALAALVVDIYSDRERARNLSRRAQDFASEHLVDSVLRRTYVDSVTALSHR